MFDGLARSRRPSGHMLRRAIEGPLARLRGGPLVAVSASNPSTANDAAASQSLRSRSDRRRMRTTTRPHCPRSCRRFARSGRSRNGSPESRTAEVLGRREGPAWCPSAMRLGCRRCSLASLAAASPTTTKSGTNDLARPREKTPPYKRQRSPRWTGPTPVGRSQRPRSGSGVRSVVGGSRSPSAASGVGRPGSDLRAVIVWDRRPRSSRRLRRLSGHLYIKPIDLVHRSFSAST